MRWNFDPILLSPLAVFLVLYWIGSRVACSEFSGGISQRERGYLLGSGRDGLHSGVLASFATLLQMGLLGALITLKNVPGTVSGLQ